jgi:hypothetical protein
MEEAGDIQLAFAAYEEAILLGCVGLHQANLIAIPLLHDDEIQLRNSVKSALKLLQFLIRKARLYQLFIVGCSDCNGLLS